MWKIVEDKLTLFIPYNLLHSNLSNSRTTTTAKKHTQHIFHFSSTTNTTRGDLERNSQEQKQKNRSLLKGIFFT